MQIYDISVEINPSLPIWPGDPAFGLERVSKIEDGANANVSRVTMGVHTGTHIDAPFHFLPEGNTVEGVALEKLIGPARVVSVPEDVQTIDSGMLQRLGLEEGVTRLLLKTRNSRFWGEPQPVFHTDFVGVSADGAEYLVSRGIQLIGIDYLSIAPYKKSRPTHEILLRNGTVIIEGLNLSAVPAGDYDLYCLPLKLTGSDGGPARAVLLGRQH
jgi:arylformamidase